MFITTVPLEILKDTNSENVPLNVPLNKRQKSLLREISINTEITQLELAEKHKVNRETIKRDLHYLQENNIIKRIGSKKIGRCEIVN